MPIILLSIVIPTFNRSYYLKRNIEHLDNEIFRSKFNTKIELIVIDNSSTDNSLSVLRDFRPRMSNFSYFKNKFNYGSDINIAKSFDIARGNFVLILGDDDFILNGALNSICYLLSDKKPDIFYLKTCGYNKSIEEVKFKNHHEVKVYKSAKSFILDINAGLTCISSLIFNKRQHSSIVAKKFIGSSLVQFEIALAILSNSKKMVASQNFYVAYKRNNSGGYNFWQVFIENLFKILCKYKKFNSQVFKKKFAVKLIFVHFPYYIFKDFLSHKKSFLVAKDIMDKNFNQIKLYKYFFSFIFFRLPFTIAPLFIIIFVGRTINGDLLKAFNFIKFYFFSYKDKFNVCK
jgi:abequosyltransferase